MKEILIAMKMTLKTTEQFNILQQVIKNASFLFKGKLERMERNEGLTKSIYCSYLSLQFHLTKDVQKYFLAAMSHPKVFRNVKLRRFLAEFAVVEAPHYKVAGKDLKNLGETPSEIPFAVELWHEYFWATVHTHPLQRIGAACILENISNLSNEIIDRLFAKADFLNKSNTVFFTIHKHEKELPHGEEILEAISECDEEDIKEIILGAKKGATLYLQMVDYALNGKNYVTDVLI